jgi:hypothetical protein
MMYVTRMRRGWRLRLTDNEMNLLREAVTRGLGAFGEEEREHLPYKVRKIFLSNRWAQPLGPLVADEDRRVV